METSVVFVHGTGVRKPGFDELFARVSGEVRANWFPVNMVPCYWGEPHGARLLADGKSIPTYDTTRALGNEEGERELWRRLQTDPLYELRLLGSQQRP